MKVTKPTVTQIDALLPQTQCRECGYDGCKLYAIALAKGEATINLCPPGGTTTLEALGILLDVDATPYVAELKEKHRLPSIVQIDEELCIGCVKCINVCPVDAITGAPKLMHTVIADECSGCELCIPVCPMDCISIQPIPLYDEKTKAEKSSQWRRRHESHLARLANEKIQQQQQHEAAKQKQKTDQRKAKQAAIAAAIARSKAKREHHHE